MGDRNRFLIALLCVPAAWLVTYPVTLMFYVYIVEGLHYFPEYFESASTLHSNLMRYCVGGIIGWFAFGR